MTIAEQIESDLQAQVVAGKLPPFPLTLSGMAEHYQVSVMPVRKAVDSLLEQSILVREKNGRLSINSAQNIGSSDKAEIAIAEKVPENPERDLKDYVISLSLRSEDDICLREEATAERFGISRMVLRSFLNRLAGEGMIEHLPRRGWRVHPFREKDMLDYIDIRETLELHALELAFEKLDRDFLVELIEGNSPDAAGKPQLDNRLHEYWISLADNRYLTVFFDQHAIYFDTLFARAVIDEETLVRRSREHRRILEALMENDLRKAQRELSPHILDQRHHISRLLDEFGNA